MNNTNVFTIGTFQIGKKIVISLGIIVVALIVVFGFYGYVNSLRTEGVNLETALSAQYQSNQNFLSAYISGFYEQLGLANAKSEKMDQILTDAVKGRYEGNGAESGFNTKGAFFSAMIEAYPNLDGLNIYDKIVDYVSSQRAGYRNIQDKLLDMLRSYDAWRGEGFIQSQIVKSLLGIPSDRLEARLPGNSIRGVLARDRMYQIVLASQAQKAYETGTMDPLQVK